MNIAFIVPSLANKGPILVVKDISDILLARGINCKVFYFDNKTELGFNCPVERISLYQPINFDAYDIIHSHMFRPDLYIAIWRKKRHIKSKFISTIHMSVYQDILFAYGKIKALITPKIWLTIWRKLDMVVVLTNVAKTEYTTLRANKNINVINNGRNINQNTMIPDLDAQFFANIKSKNLKLLGTVASFNKRKGLEQVIYLLERFSDIAFIIVGEGEEQANLETLARERNVYERCFFIGPRINGYAYMKHFDVYILPSRSEGLPLALIEAVASHVPVICSDIDVFRETFSDNEVAFFTLDNIDSLRDAYLKTQSFGKDLASKAHLKYLECFTADKMAMNYYSLYTSLTN